MIVYNPVPFAAEVEEKDDPDDKSTEKKDKCYPERGPSEKDIQDGQLPSNG